MYRNDDLELIGRAQKGELQAFEELILCYEKDIYNIAYRMFGNSQDAEDIAQEVCIKIYNKIRLYNKKSRFYTWIYRITVNTCIDEIRKKSNSTQFIYIDERLDNDDSEVEKQYKDEKELTPEQKYIKKEEEIDIMQKIGKLEPEYRIVIILKYIKDLDYEEIAESLECSLGTVKSRLNRAKKKLYEIFNNMEQKQNKARLTSMKGGDEYESK